MPRTPPPPLPEWERVLHAAHARRDAADALAPLDRLYPQPNKESPLPYDLEETRLREYKRLVPRWHDWNAVKRACARCATSLFDRLAARKRR
jgi:hypothetical protein